MQHERGRGYVFMGLLAALAACSGLEPTPSGSESATGVGGTGAFLHGDAACGNTAGTSGAGGSPSAAGGKSSVPSDFGSGGSSGSSSNGGKGSTSSTGGTGGDEPQEAGGAGGSGEQEQPLGHALLITEYVEGSSSYKAIEISALADSSLEGCRVATYFNGGTSANGAALEGVLFEGESTVLCSSALAAQGAVCPRTAGLTFNGDDAVALECEGVVIDVMGQIGVDPGTAWGTGDVSTVDHTLRRRCDAIPDTDPTNAFEPSSGWLGAPKDSFDDLGRRDCASAGAAGASGDSSD